MSRSVLTLTFLVTLVICCSCSPTRSRKSENKSEAIFVINNYGRLYEPICVNYFGLANIEKFVTGRDKKSKKGLMTIYMKDSVKLISFNTFLERNGLDNVVKRTDPIYLDTTLVLKPQRLVFVASQKFKVDSVYYDKGTKPSEAFILRISPNK